MADQLFFERFIWFDSQVRKGRYPTAAALARQFELSDKTAQRSIEYFRYRLRAPLEYDSSRKGYYYDDPSFSLPLSKLTEQELVSLLVSRKLLSDASGGELGEELDRLVKKLGGLLSASLPGKIEPEDAFSFRWNQFAPASGNSFQIASTSLLHGRLLSFCYYAPSTSDTTIRTVEPHHMLNYLGSWHLIAFCRLRNGWRDFLLSRISMMKIEEEEFQFRPVEEWRKSLEETYGIFQNQTSFQVVLKFSPEQSKWVKGEIWHHDQQEESQEDGSLILTLPASHHAEIMKQILGHGSQVEVIEPIWLRKMVKKEINRMRKVYAS